MLTVVVIYPFLCCQDYSYRLRGDLLDRRPLPADRPPGAKESPSAHDWRVLAVTLVAAFMAAFTEFCAGSYLSRFVPGDCAADEEMVRHRHGDQEFAEVPTTIVARTAAKANRKG